jgi:indole-3-glycerol phosphate synthase
MTKTINENESNRYCEKLKMILDEIVENTRKELEERKRICPLEKIKQNALTKPPPLDLAMALSGNCMHLIAEVKKASPSRGVICQDFNPVQIAKTYAENGAAAISILTDNRYFQGDLNYLSDIYCALDGARPPLLRKDFIFEKYQVYESRAYGADAILLIAAILNPDELADLIDLSHRLNMKCLVEVHNDEEVDIANHSEAKIIGINNRDLSTFQVDLNVTGRLRPMISGDRIVVSESGIKTRQDIKKLQRWGVNAVLIGETLTSSNDIASKMKELLA